MGLLEGDEQRRVFIVALVQVAAQVNLGAGVEISLARFLGYDRGEDGNLVVNPEQTVTVKRIYRLFLQGKTPHGICQILMDDGIPSPGGKKKWNQSTVKSILMKPSIFDLLQAHPFTPCFSGGG